MAKNYEVGYGKPPKNTQFKDGQSGNPRGRPKGHKNVRTIVNEMLNRSVKIKESGRTRRVKFLEAFVRQLGATALNGSTRDQIALFKLIHEYAPELLKEPEQPPLIMIEFVSPDGKTVDPHLDSDLSLDTLDKDPKASPAQERPDPRSDEDDS